MVLYPNKLPESERVCSGICTLAGKDDLGEREEEVEYCFKDFHKLEGFFNF